MKKIITLFILVFVFINGYAHKADQTYIYFKIFKDSIEGRVEITIEDINKALKLNIDPAKYKPIEEEDKGEYPLPPELNQYLPQIQNYIVKNSKIKSTNGTHNMQFTEATMLKLFMGTYILYHFELDNSTPVPDALEIEYEILLKEDRNQTGGILVEHNWKAGVINNESMVSLLFRRGDGKQTLDLTKQSIWKGIWALIQLGMWHIYIGLDHILFLVALLLPSVVRRKENYQTFAFQNQWNPVDRFKSAFWYILKIVTLFTIAHTITLSLAALNVINLSARIVESLIALSIGLAAFLFMKPLINKSESYIAFGFGLFHGLGFASVLGEKGLGDEYLVYSLLGFNVGVEIGQVLIISAIFPVLYFLSKTRYYPKLMFWGGILLISISLYWFVERFFEVDFLIDNYIARAISKVKYEIGIL
jgi:hypothetical protein